MPSALEELRSAARIAARDMQNDKFVDPVKVARCFRFIIELLTVIEKRIH